MALSSALITYDLESLLGEDFVPDSIATLGVRTNIPGETVVDTVGNTIRVGPSGGKISSGTGSLSVWVPGAGSNPNTWQTYIDVTYRSFVSTPDGGYVQKRSLRTFGPFTITGNADLADLIAEQEVPPTYLSTLTAQLDGYVDQASADADRAEAAADQAQDVSNISTPDALIANRIETPGTATSNALTVRVGALGQPFFASKGGVNATAGNTQRFLTKLYRNVEDANVLHVGTSLGNATDEYVYLTWTQFAARFPTHTFIYHLWDAGTEADWSATTTTLQTGTGPRTVHIWNGCVPGMRTDYFLGSRWPKAVATNADLTFVEYGKNEGPTSQLTESHWRGQYLALTEQLRSDLPYSGVVCILEPLDVATTDMAVKNRVYESVAQQLGLGVINTHDAFLATGNPNAYMKVDGIHPTTSVDAPAPNGSQLMADCILAALNLNIRDGAVTAQRSSLFSDLATQLMPNGGFGAWTGASPDGWTLVGAATSKDARAGYFESANGYSCRIQATGAAPSSMYRDVPSVVRWRGKWVTLAVRMRVPAGAAGTSGRVQVSDGVSPITSYGALASARDGFHWKIIPFKVAPAAAYLRVTVFGDTAANAAADVSVDAVYVVEGALPKRAAEGVVGPAGPAGPEALTAVDHLSTIGTRPTDTATANVSVPLSVANTALLVPVKPARNMSLAKLSWLSRTASGSYDIGIYDAAGTRLWAKGSTAWPAGNAWTDETVSPAVALVAGTTYWVAFSGDNITGAFQGMTAQSVEMLRLADGTHFARTVGTAFPLPSTITLGATGSAKLPAIVLKEA